MVYAVHVVLAMGLGLLIFGAVRLYPYYTAKRWQPRTAKIVSFSEGSVDVVIAYGLVRCFYPKVEYAYDVDGVTYHSSRAGFKEGDIQRPAIDKWGVPVDKANSPWAAWSEGAAITVYVDPANPGRSVIFRDISQAAKSQYRTMMFGGILLIAVWTLLLLTV